MAEITSVWTEGRGTPQDGGEPRRWIRVLKATSAHPRARLVCFPHAGGSAAFFRPWIRQMPQDLELLAVRYPAREDRLRDLPARSMDELAEPTAQAIASLEPVPCAFFGHSMGSLVAYETALRLEHAGGAAPRMLFVSGSSGPGSPGRGAAVRADASDQELVDDLVRLGGIEPGLLENRELRELVLPAVRADYRNIETYHPSPSAAVSIPIVAYYGTEDDGLGAEPVAAWSGFTRHSFDSRSFAGGHFYLTDHLPALVQDVLARLAHREAS